MSKSGALDLATSIGGMIEGKDVLSAVSKYEKYHGYYGGKEEDRKRNYADLENKYYDLSTSFIEFGWGESFHFASRWKGETFQESIKRHEHFLALQLRLEPEMKVLDVGCGIGGPLREIARFSHVSVTGLNNNEYQISRGMELNRLHRLDKSCGFVKADFMKMPYLDNSFDAIYAIESTCYAPDVVGCYKEIYRVLKPGQCFAAYDICLTESYDPNNSEHQKIKAVVELGTGIPGLRTTSQSLEALEKAGFEVVRHMDLSQNSPVPWYAPLESPFSLSGFRLTAAGRFITMKLIKAVEYVGLMPQGSHRITGFLDLGAHSQIEGARRGIYTPLFFFLARKPLSASQEEREGQ